MSKGRLFNRGWGGWSTLLRVFIVARMSILLTGCIAEEQDVRIYEDCEPETNRTCFCVSGESGVQTCASDGLSWDPCLCSCTPGDTLECEIDGTIGLRECDKSGDYWSPCQPVEQVVLHQSMATDDPRCGVGEVYCPDVGCVNLSNSSDNCGACGNACEGCDRCFLGLCSTVCCADEANCGSQAYPICSDLDSDPDNCGACGLSCDDNETCIQGFCEYTF